MGDDIVKCDETRQQDANEVKVILKESLGENPPSFLPVAGSEQPTSLSPYQDFRTHLPSFNFFSRTRTNLDTHDRA